jgi:uncharacterized protein (DUF2267 family)
MKKDEFLARVRTAGDLPGPKEAERWATTALGALTQLLPDPELRRHFVSQLPRFLKSRLRDEPPPPLSMDRNALFQHVGAALGAHAAEGRRAVRAVYAVLRAALSAGQIAEFEAHVPKDVAAFLARPD